MKRFNMIYSEEEKRVICIEDPEGIFVEYREAHNLSMGLGQERDDLAELLVDAELITRSRCKEITGKSLYEIAQMLVDSPIYKAGFEAAKAKYQPPAR